MPLKYHLVRRLDMRKNAPEGATLLYGQIRSERKITFDKLCKEISRVSTASKGDVMIVINTMVEAMVDHLEHGDVIQVGDLGNFRMVAGCKGVETTDEFEPSLFKKGKIVFTPGATLRNLTTELTFEKIRPLKEESEENAGDDQGSL